MNAGDDTRRKKDSTFPRTSPRLTSMRTAADMTHNMNKTNFKLGFQSFVTADTLDFTTSVCYMYDDDVYILTSAINKIETLLVTFILKGFF